MATAAALTFFPLRWAGWRHLPPIGAYAGLSCPNQLQRPGHAGAPLQAPHADHSPPSFDGLRGRLEAYFSGANVDFEDDLDLEGASDFMVKAWKACRSIPKGEVRTYNWLAEQAGNRRAARAAGLAMSRNRAPIIIPCHRVIGSDGSLHGYCRWPATEAAVAGD